MIYLYSFLSSFFLSLAITPLIILLARRLQVIDVPKEPRKLHDKPTPLLGGTAIFLSFIFTLLLFLYLGFVIDKVISYKSVFAIIIGGIVIQFGGIIDDKYNLRPSWQIFFPILAAMTAIILGVQISFVTNPMGGVLHIMPWIGSGITFFWLMGMMYTMKFLDGLDGLAAGEACIASLIIFVVSLFWDVPQSGTSLLSLMIAGSTLGFLIFNFYPAKVFLGEGGSVFLGFVLGILSIVSGSKIATAMLIMGLPIIDTLWVIIKRVQEKKSPFVGDRKHFHFKLLDSGMNQTQAVFFIYAITALFGIISLFLGTKGKIFSIAVLVALSVAMIKRFYIKKSI